MKYLQEIYILDEINGTLIEATFSEYWGYDSAYVNIKNRQILVSEKVIVKDKKEAKEVMKKKIELCKKAIELNKKQLIEYERVLKTI